jgi:hypothetical protein
MQPSEPSRDDANEPSRHDEPEWAIEMSGAALGCSDLRILPHDTEPSGRGLGCSDPSRRGLCSLRRGLWLSEASRRGLGCSEPRIGSRPLQ